MCKRKFPGLWLLTTLAIGLVGGWLPMTASADEGAGAAASPGTPIARIHWLGKQGLAAETNAAAFMAIWNLAESQKLEVQTLDKLALALASAVQPALSNKTATALIRPLLEDLLKTECCLEVRRAGNQPAASALAIRLEVKRAALWQTNLSAVLAPVPGVRLVSSPGAAPCWQFPNAVRLSLAQSGDWTVLSLAPEGVPAISPRLPSRGSHSSTNYWLEAELEAQPLAEMLGVGGNLTPKISLSMIGDGATAITRAELDFSKPLALALSPWNLPTNLICGKLLSFSAIRGIGSWVASLPAWRSVGTGTPPNECYSWSLLGPALQSYFAIPDADASNRVSRLTDFVLEKGATWFEKNPGCKFKRADKCNGLDWHGLGFIAPFLHSVDTNHQAFVFGGLFPQAETSFPVQPELQQKLGQPNLVAYDWEITPVRVESWFNIGQTLRLALRRGQLPTQSASAVWLKAAGAKLWPTVTEVTQTGPSRLTLKRRSSLGLTGIELHVLAEWLESPRFPCGLYSLLTPALSPAPAMAAPPAPKPNL